MSAIYDTVMFLQKHTFYCKDQILMSECLNLPDNFIATNILYDLDDWLQLPSGVKTLEFSTKFNQPIDLKLLPRNLKTLRFGIHFNQVIEPGILPSGLRFLSLGVLQHPIGPGVLPSSLEKLYLGWRFNQPILPGVIPLNLVCCYKKIKESI